MGAVDDGFRARRIERTKTTARGMKVRAIPKAAKKMASLESPIRNWRKPKIQIGRNQIKHYCQLLRSVTRVPLTILNALPAQKSHHILLNLVAQPSLPFLAAARSTMTTTTKSKMWKTIAIPIKARKKKKIVVYAFGTGILCLLTYVEIPVLNEASDVVYNVSGSALETSAGVLALALGTVENKFKPSAKSSKLVISSPVGSVLYGEYRRLIYSTPEFVPLRDPPVLLLISLMLFCMALEWKRPKDQAKF